MKNRTTLDFPIWIAAILPTAVILLVIGPHGSNLIYAAVVYGIVIRCLRRFARDGKDN